MTDTTCTIGIDPGRETGISVLLGGAIHALHTIAPAELESLLIGEHWRITLPARVGLVVYEDSRQNPIYERKGQGVRGMRAIARSVGGIDLQCRDIEEACARLGIPCIGVSPQRKGRKLNAKHFAAATGWTALSNRHTRDATMVAWLYRRAQPGQSGFIPRPTRRRRGQP